VDESIVFKIGEVLLVSSEHFLHNRLDHAMCSYLLVGVHKNCRGCVDLQIAYSLNPSQTA